MKETGLQVRQGDVLLVKIDAIPKDAEKQTDDIRIVLAYGEKTGHAHAISTKHASRYEWNGNTLVDVRSHGKLEHEEHGTIALEAGAWLKVQQRQYTPAGIRGVAD